MGTIPRADSGLRRFARQIVRTALRWAMFSFPLNLAWETAQSPLYTYLDVSGLSVPYSILHCTVGDIVISVGSLLLAGFMLRDPDWPAVRPWAGGAIATAFGLIYTAYSEWFNVYQLGSWGYAANMPLILGIGVAPLLQWLVLPVLTVWCLRSVRPGQSEPDRI